jgi:prolyl-tRNA editing enzyme YbaK/EbsC (Cys-tRNA(Pro) deacylase)
MSLSKQLAHYLQRHGVSYLEVPKEDAFTSATVARGRRLKRRGLAKVVALRNEDHDWLLAVVPDDLFVDLKAVELASGDDRLGLASELDVARHFGSRELGGGAAFDDLSGAAVYLDESFGDRTHIYFADGSRRGVFALRLRDYMRLARPIVGAFAIATRRQVRNS